MRATRLGLLLIASLLSAAAHAEHLTQARLLERLIDLDRLAAPPPRGESAGLFSSYDRDALRIDGGRYVNWKANRDAGQFLRSAGGWDVMAEMKGPGVITRFWCDRPQGTVRIEIDEQAVIEAEFADLFDGKQAPFGEPFSFRVGAEGGWCNYFPIGYAKSCRVSSKEFKGAYQIDYTTFDRETTVEPFAAELSDESKKSLEEVAQVLRTGLPDARITRGKQLMPVALQSDPPLKPRQKLADALTGAGTVRAFYVSVSGRKDPVHIHALHQCVLRVWWDGEKEPSIEAPLIDFFGAGFERNPVLSLPMGTEFVSELPVPKGFAYEGKLLYCYFPMPFSNGMRFEVENLGESAIGLMTYMRIDRSPPAKDALRFRARFRREAPCGVFDYPLLEAAGRGRYVGAVLSLDCPRRDWWGEGDHKVWVDSNEQPMMLGTGTADYFGSANPPRLYSHAQCGVSLLSPFGKQSLFRWHLSDSIPFQTSLRLTLENLHAGDASDTDYASVAYWYSEAGAKQTLFKPLAAADLEVRGVRIPNAVEVEGNILTEGWGNVVTRRQFPELEWSGQAAASVSLVDKPVQIRVAAPRAGAYRLKARIVMKSSFREVEFSGPDGKPIGTVAYAQGGDGIYEVGTVTLAAGENIITIRCSRAATLDCLILDQP